MKLNFTFLFAVLITLSTASCKQNESASGIDNAADTIPDSVTVDLKTARRYVANYAPHAGNPDQTEREIAEKVPKKPDTRAIWFDKKRLQQMLAQLEKEKGDGVRFYLITYDNTYDTTKKSDKPVPPSKYWGYNTLLMVSTKDSLINGKKVHADYYTDTVVGGEPKSKTKKRGFIVTYVPENRGELCPPPASCKDEGADLLDKP